MSNTETKTLDVMSEMAELFHGVKAGDIELKQSAELSNIAGKYLKAEALAWVKYVWVEEHAPKQLKAA